VRGDLEVNGEKLTTGDGLAIEDVNALNMKAISEVEFLLFDLG
jgi:redox-sensitive bicupin YhaK (pirin superfamily)